MKTKIFFSSLMSLLFASSFAQDRTTVNAMSSEISDNLDLRAVASIFGDSKNLEDFENRLNDPNNQISNLDLNNDNQVDYLRVIESVEGYSHIIVVQSVLGFDKYQDVASIEVERDSNNRVSVQVVGDVYMYGANYIYEPVYVHTPIIYSYFWVPNYRPYCSTWYWGYYPSFYYAWNPFPIFRYRSHIGLYINFGHQYNYVTTRRCQVAYNNYYGRRANAYERQYPTRSFASRNSNVSNRYELDRTRNIRTVGGGTRDGIADAGTRNNPSRNNGARNDAGSRADNPRGTSTTRDNSNAGGTRGVRTDNPRGNGAQRDNSTTGGSRGNGNANPRTDSAQRDNTYSAPNPRNNGNGNPRGNTAQRDNTYSSPSPRGNEPRNLGNGNSRGNTAQRDNSYSTPTPRSAEPRNIGNGNPRSNSPQRDNSFGSPAPRNESRNMGNPNAGGMQSRGMSAGNAPSRGSEQRNAGGGNPQRGGGESRGQGR